MSVRILGTGKSLPSRVVENAELEDRMGIPRGWIEKRTGIKSRRYVDTGVATTDLALPAVYQALENARLKPNDLDAIIGACAVPEQAIPATSCFMQAALGLNGPMCFDVNATCFSFPMALWTASQLVQSGQAGRVLVFSSECSSLALDFETPESAALFGDGAGAVVIGPSGDTSSRLVGLKMKTFSEGRHLAQLRVGGTRCNPSSPDWNAKAHKFAMNGKGIFKMAFKYGDGFLDDFFTKVALPQEEWKLVIPHQTSVHGVSIYSRKLGFSTDQVFTNLENHGNCVSASIPMALHDAIEQRRISRGDPVLLLGTAAGLSLGALGLVY
jgi:3-oxoacyl-[acyl-carrier-protein] synthase-3